MDIAIFFYNLLIMSSYIFCCAIFLLFYVRHRDKCQLYISLMFSLFIIDNLVLYMNELLPAFSAYYTMVVVPEPYITNFLWLAIVFCYRIILCSIDRKELGTAEKLFWIGLLLLVFLATALYSKTVFKYVVLLVRHSSSIAVFGIALFSVLKRGNAAETRDERFAVPKIGAPLIIAALVLQITAAIEGVAEVFWSAGLIEGRYLSIELIGVLFSAAAIWFVVPHLVSPLSQNTKSTAPALSDGEMLNSFCDTFELTRRERDVLYLLIQGLSNAEISKKIYISEGTVKAHVHNIYTKLGVNSRLQLSAKLTAFGKK